MIDLLRRHKSHFWSLLVRYCTGESDDREVQEVESRIAVDPEAAAAHDDLMRIWEAARHASGQSFDEEAAVLMLRQRVEAWENRPVDRQSRGGKSLWLIVPDASGPLGTHASARPATRTRPWSLGRRRGSFAVLGGATVLVAFLLVVIGPETSSRKADNPWQVVETTAGQRFHLRLLDGTQVDLGSESRLVIPRDFGAQARNVDLEGEAFFSVARQPDKPFSIQSGGTRIQVRGTSFDVRAYPDETHVIVAVESGELVVWPNEAEPDDTLHLHARQVARASREGTAVLAGVDLAPYLAWREGRLIFADTPMHAVAKTLRRSYGVRFRFADSALEARRLTAEFDSEPLGQVLESIALVMDLEFLEEEQEGEILIR